MVGLSWHGSRIQQRGRAMEVEGGWSYAEIASMAKFYRTYANDVRKFGFHRGPILEIDVDKIDLSNRIHMGYLFELVYDALTTTAESGDLIDQQLKDNALVGA